MRKKVTVGRYPNWEAAIAAGYQRADYRGAFLSEVMGPYFKPILWVDNAPFARKKTGGNNHGTSN